MIPLFQANGSTLTSLNGRVSKFYQIAPSDIEGHEDKVKKSIFKELERSLINTDDELKIYHLDGKLYFNTFSEIDLNHAKISECNDSIEVFCGGAYSNAVFYENYYTQGSKFKRILSVKEFPAKIDMLDSSYWGDFVLNIKKVDKLKAKSKVNMKRKIHYSNLFKGIRDIESENAYNEAEELLDGLSSGEMSLFEAEMFLIVTASTKDELDNKTDDLIEEFKAIDSKLLIEEKGLSFFYKTIVPGVEPSFKRADLCPSDYLSYLVPFHRDMVHDKGILLKSRDYNDIKLNIFDRASLNFNVLITGSSGQGKSMMANKILDYELKNKTKGIVLDLGNSFKKTTDFYNGIVLSDKFNPLQFKDARYLKEFVLSAIDEKFSKKDEGRLFEAITSIVEDSSINSFDKFIRVLEKEFNGISYNFSEIKEYFTDEINPLNDLTYCDFSNYPEAMKAPLIIYLIEYFKNLSGKKIFIFDECWHLLNKNADYIAECFRTFRKHNASAIAISQNLDDFSITQLGRVIIQNTYLKLMFKQSLKASEFLNQHTVKMINCATSKKGEYSEFILVSEEHKKPIRFYSTYLEYELYTSDKNDNAKIDNYLEQTAGVLDFKEALINFTKIKHPYWEYQDEN
ncbi:MAG: hypothetical protein N4A33_02950 [Bacteriovoracaceae bacterium]|jgi:hypothetical protein|nr:hypothetical protein [Bacteriovoracaceae bacterium]